MAPIFIPSATSMNPRGVHSPPHICGLSPYCIFPLFGTATCRYEYVLPVKAFDKRWGLPREDRLDVNADPNANAPEPADSRVPPPPTQPSDTCFEFDESVRQRLNRVLSHYVGTRNFHNFTVRVSPTDESAKRYILSFEASAPFEVMGEKFVSLVVLGQSFMLHQIRKMVGMALAVMRDVAPESAPPSPRSPDLQLQVGQVAGLSMLRVCLGHVGMCICSRC